MNKRLKNFIVFLFFFSLTALLYFPTIHSKFVFDFVDLVFDFQRKGWSNLGNISSGLSPYLVAKAIFFVLLKLIRFNAYAWYFLSCLLHALNAFLLIRFSEKLFYYFDYEQPFLASLFVAILFLVSPYHTEAVVWSGAFNYLIVSALILLQLNAVLDYIETKSDTYLLISVCAFFAAMFTHEWGLFLLPADLFLFFFLTDKVSDLWDRKYLPLVCVIIFLTGYYFFNQWLQGSLVGHYGAETHLNFKLHEIVPAFCKYLLKVLFLFTFFPVPVQDRVYAFIQQPAVLYSLVVISIIVSLILSALLRKSKERFGLPLFFFLLFCIFVFPVLNLYFPYWIKIHADRYCYLPCAFMYASCVAILFRAKNSLKFVFSLVFMGVSIYLLAQVNFSWHQAGKLEQQLERNFSWWNAKRVYILNLPDNFRGAYMYRNSQPSAFAGNFVKYNYATPKTEIIEVLNYNLNEADDSVTVENISDHKLKVTLSKWGTWWWRNTVGATDYETDRIKVDVDDYGHSYLIEFKQKQEGDVFLYQANGNWRAVQNF